MKIKANVFWFAKTILQGTVGEEEEEEGEDEEEETEEENETDRRFWKTILKTGK